MSTLTKMAVQTALEATQIVAPRFPRLLLAAR